MNKFFENLSAKVFYDNRLGGMLQILFDSHPIEAYNFTYPGKFKPWEFRQVPANFWSRETGIAATKWLIEEKLKWSDKEVIEKLTWDVYRANGLGGMLQHVFNHSPFAAITHAYPEKFKAWEFRHTPKKHWNKENALVATKWLIEDKLKWNEEDIRKNLSVKTFKDNDLGGMLACSFSNSPYDAINNVYPNKFKPWELKNAPMNFCNKETAILATKWLVEEKLKLSKEDIAKISRADFKKFGLAGMVFVVFKGKHKEALRVAYPYSAEHNL